MLKSLTIKHKIYVAFFVILASLITSTVINDRLVASITQNTEDTTNLIESLNLGSQSIQSHAYQARTIFTEILNDPNPDTSKHYTDHIYGIQTIATFMLQTEYARAEELSKTFETPIELSDHLVNIIASAEKITAYFQENIKNLKPSTGVGSQSDIEFDGLYEDIEQRLSQYSDSINSQASSKAALKARFSIANAHVYLAEYLSGDSSENPKQIIQDIQTASALITPHTSMFAKDLKRLEKLASSRIDIYHQRVSISTPVKDTLNAFFDELLIEIEQLNQSLLAYDSFILKELKNKRDNIETITLLLSGFSIVTALLISYLIIRNLIQPLNTLKSNLVNIANGNHTPDIPMQQQPDELGEVARAIQQLKIKSIERKGFESANLAIKERLENMLESAPVGLIEVDKDGKIIMANNALTELFGYSNQELAGKAIEFLLPKSFHKVHVNLRKSFFKEGKNRQMSNGRVVEIQDKYNNTKFVQISLSNIKSEVEEYVIASILDVTNLRTLQDELSEQSSLLSSMIRDAPEAIIIANPDRTIRMINPMFTALFGYELNEIVEKKTELLYVSQASFEKTGKERYNTVGSSNYQAYEIEYRKKNGDIFLSETVGGSIKNQDGEVIGHMAFIRDITERKSHEKILKNYQRQIEDSNNRLQLATQSAHTGIWELDISSQRLHWDDAMLSIYGQSRQNFHERYEDWAKQVLDKDLDVTKRDFEQAIKDKAQYNATFRIVHPELGIRYIEAHATPQLDAKGNIERMVGVNRDITEKAQQQKQLKKNHKLLSAISRAQQQFIGDSNIREVFDILLMDILEITGSEYGFIGEILHQEDGSPYLKTHAISNIAWNEETEKFYEENAPKGMEFYNLKTLFGEVLTTQKTVICNTPMTHPASGGLPEGHPDLNAFLGQPFFSGNKMMGMVGIANRQSGYDQELVEFLEPLWGTLGQLIEALRMDQVRSEQEQQVNQLALVASKTKNAVVITDKDGVIKWVNKAFTHISGYTFQEAKGQKPGKLLQGPHTDPETIEFMSNCLRNGEAFQAELINYHKDGSEYWLSIEIQPVRNDNGEITEFIAVETDITQKKAAEEELHDAVARAESFAIKAEQANTTKSEFLANMSHEIRTPMNGVIGMLDLLLRGDLSDQQKKYTHMAQSSAESLLTLINDILDFSKIEAGKLDLEDIPFDLTKLISDFVQTFIYRAQEKDIQVNLDLTQIQNNTVMGDPSRVIQVLNNLCGNALKFTHEGQISVTAVQKNDYVTIAIKDSGIGIDKEKIDTLFTKFTQADGSTTRKYGGTGLGLSISKQLCEMMNGGIWVESKAGEGSTFSFKVQLPTTNEDIQSASSISNQESKPVTGMQPTPISQENRPLLLLVEDNLINQEVAKGIIEDLGYDIDTADNGQEALEKLSKSHDYLLVLMDCQMPIMDGYQATGEIRSGQAGSENQNIPIIAMTANAMKGDKEKCLAAGMDGYLSKPLDITNLEQTLAQWRNRRDFTEH